MSIFIIMSMAFLLVASMLLGQLKKVGIGAEIIFLCRMSLTNMMLSLLIILILLNTL